MAPNFRGRNDRVPGRPHRGYLHDVSISGISQRALRSREISKEQILPHFGTAVPGF